MPNVTALQFSLKKYPFKYYKPHISLAWNKNVHIRAAFKCIHCLNEAKVAYLNRVELMLVVISYSKYNF